MELLVFFFLVLLFAMVRSRLSVDRPGVLQHIFEIANGIVDGQSSEIIGHHSEGFTAFLIPLGFFILICNLIGVIPGFESPTAVVVVPLGCAISAFVYYQVQGFKHAGVAYLKHFAGPMPVLAPLMVPIELISHLARVLSLTVRLYANMFAGDLVTLAFFSLVPIGLPLIFLGLHLFVSLLQTYIFVLLTTVYIAGAVAEEH
jgi:F-type H+-transporting ATPase subunit a